MSKSVQTRVKVMATFEAVGLITLTQQMRKVLEPNLAHEHSSATIRIAHKGHGQYQAEVAVNFTKEGQY